MDYLFLILGIAILLFSGEWLVRAGSSLAKHFKIPPFIIGVTIISFGTSAPELFVSLSAAINGNPDIALGNVIGSNIANIGLVLGITALIITIPISRQVIKFDYPVLLLSGVIFVIFMANLTVSRWEGFIMVLMMGIYIYLIIKNTKREEPVPAARKEKIPHPMGSLFIIILTCGGLLLGSNLLVDGASGIAKSWGVSERVISISVIAVGTSLPELVTSVIAAIRKQLEISIGNIIGSNIFNVLMIAGLSAMIKPLNVNPEIMKFDVYFFLGFAVLLGICFLPLKNPRINKWKGVIMLVSYLTYCILLFNLLS